MASSFFSSLSSTTTTTTTSSTSRINKNDYVDDDDEDDIPQLTETFSISATSTWNSTTMSTTGGSTTSNVVSKSSSSFHRTGSSNSTRSLKQQQPTLRHQSSSFLRTYGLNLDDRKNSRSIDDDDEYDNDDDDSVEFPYSESPKPDEKNSSDKNWVALDMLLHGSTSTRISSPGGAGQMSSASPCLSIIVESLVQSALKAISNDSIWTRSSESTSSSSKHPIDIWTGYLPYEGYGSDIPAVKSSGIIPNMTADQLIELLCDSSRVKEYNKNSIGRHDVVIYRNDLSFDSNKNQNRRQQQETTEEGVASPSITKIIHSSAELPTSMIRVIFEFLSIFHVRRLTPQDNMGEGYICVCRAVESTHPTYKEPGAYTMKEQQKKKSSGGFFGVSRTPQVVRGEILLNVHLITTLPRGGSGCRMTNINHLMSSSMIPSFIGKQLGLTAALNFMNDIRAV